MYVEFNNQHFQLRCSYCGPKLPITIICNILDMVTDNPDKLVRSMLQNNYPINDILYTMRTNRCSSILPFGARRVGLEKGEWLGVNRNQTELRRFPPPSPSGLTLSNRCIVKIVRDTANVLHERCSTQKAP